MTPAAVEARFKRASTTLFRWYGRTVDAAFGQFVVSRNRPEYDEKTAAARQAYINEWEKIEGRYHSEMADADPPTLAGGTP